MIRIKDSIQEDIGHLVANLRLQDRIEVDLFDIDPEEFLNDMLEKALYKKTIFVDNKVAGMWGVSGELFGTGWAYFLTGEEINRIHPIKFIRLYKQEIEAMKKMYQELCGFVDGSYKESIRTLELAGFTVSDKPRIRLFSLKGYV